MGAAVLVLGLSFLPQAAAVFDTWKPERKPIAQLAEGDHVTGMEGAVVTLQAGVTTLSSISRSLNCRTARDAEAPIARPPILSSAGSCGGPK